MTPTLTNIAPRVLVSDDTEYYALEGYTDRIVRIENVFLYDSNRAVNLCELTPSYDCAYLYTNIEFADGVEGEERDELHERFGFEDVDDKYIHCRSVRPVRVLPDVVVPFEYDEEEGPADFEEAAEEAYREAWEELVDYYRCNCPV